MHLLILVAVISVVCGTLLPFQNVCLLAGILAAVSVRVSSYRWLLLVVAVSSVWGSFYTSQRVALLLPEEISGERFKVAGCIAEPAMASPTLRSGQTVLRFVLSPQSVTFHGDPVATGDLRLSWYNPGVESFLAGDCIDAEVTLKRPRNIENDLAFDYELWLMREGVTATGYVRSLDFTQQLSRGSQSETRLSDNTKAWIDGLVFGKPDAFTPHQWRLVRNTGTLHVLVVSGLHVGMVAMVAFVLASALVRLLRVVGIRTGTYGHWIARMAAVAMTGGYVLVAGSGIALIRAWLLATLLMLLWGAARQIRFAQVLSLVMLVTLIADPLLWTSAGFLYSFVAVYALILLLEGRRNGVVGPWMVPQFAVMAGLAPVMMIWGQPLGVVHVIANTLIIPLISFCILPLSLLLSVYESEWADTAMQYLSDLFWQLQTLFDAWSLPAILPGAVWVLPWIALVLLWRAGLHWAHCALGVALFTLAAHELTDQTSKLWLFDVGQGQSLMVRDAGRTLVIDTGAAYSPDFSMASAVVIPWLEKSGAESLDLLVISHSDNDHAGGLESLLAQYPAVVRFAGQPAMHQAWHFQDCHERGLLALSDRVSLKFFSLPEALRRNDNDHSCVLQLNYYGRRVLIPGDITAQAEAALVDLYGDDLQSDVLVAAHHGSRTSSAEVWLDTVAPAEVWISSGYKNRYGHPHTEVLRRLKERNIRLFLTAESGFLSIDADGHRDCGRCGWAPWWR